MSTAISIIEAIIGFGLLIFVHELGHFLTAKWIGVRVEAFSLGFGPCLKRKWGQTEYRLSLIPLGGYVKMAGEEPKEGEKPAPDEFYGKSVGRRAIVFAAGATMNLIFGCVMFILAYQVGVPSIPAKIGHVTPGAPAWDVGLRAGDEITGIEGISSPVDFEDLRTSIVLARSGRGVRLSVKRDGESFEKVVSPEYDENLGLLSIGIRQASRAVLGEPSPSAATEDGPNLNLLFDAGLKVGDIVTDVWLSRAGEGDGPTAGEKHFQVTSPIDFEDAINECGGKPIRIGFTRNEVPQTPVTVSAQREKLPQWLGVRWGANQIEAVRQGGWAATAGFQEGDVVVAVGGKPTRSRTDVAEALDARGENDVSVTVRRKSGDIGLTVPGAEGGDSVAAELAFALQFVVDRTLPGYPAEAAGLEPGDEIVSVNGEKLEKSVDLHQAVVAAEGKPVSLEVRRGTEELHKDVTPARRWMIAAPWQMERTIVRAGLLGSFRLGMRKEWQWIRRVPATIRGLIGGSVSTRNLNGVIVIGYVTYAAAKTGFGALLYMLALFSVNFGIVNLLPIPVLDGGHLLFAVVEKVRGKPLNEKIRGAATYVGLACILALVAVAFWNDMRMLLFGWG